MPRTKKIRLALIAGLAALAAALAFTAALRFAEDSRDETAQQETPPANAGGESTDSLRQNAEADPDKETASAETPLDASSTGGVSGGEAQETPQPSLAHDKTTLGALGPDLERWLQIARMQLEEEGEQSAEIERILEHWRAAMESMDPSEWEAYFDKMGYYFWKWNPHLSDRLNRIHQKLFELNGALDYPKSSEKTPLEIIEILVEGMDDLTAAQKLYQKVLPYDPEWRWRSEPEYAKIYLERALAKDPTSRDALALKIIMSPMEERGAAARRLIELHPNDTWAVSQATSALWRDHPEEAIAAIEPLFASKETPTWAHMYLSFAYERLDMMDKAVYHNGFIPIPETHGRSPTIYPAWVFSPERRRFPSIWEERAAAAEAAQQALPPAESPAPGFEAPPDPRDFEPPRPHDDPDAPRGVEPPPPPPDAEMDMAAAYADFAKAYQSAFEMEYALSEATPEGYMNALLGMARAFARAGDAERAQNAYNAARKRYSPEEIQQAFRRFDEQDRLRRQASNEEDDDEDE